MGAWSSKPFGNDTALDWLIGLEESADGSYLASTIAAATTSSGPVEHTTAEEAVAAATIIGGAAFEPPRRVPPEAKAWISKTGFAPSRELLQQTATALERIQENSELRDAWDEAGGSGWVKQVEKLRTHVDEAIAGDPIQRKPKKPGMPRSLYKLVERQAKDPDEKVRAKIAEKLRALNDINESSRDTNFDVPISLLAKHGLVDEAKLALELGADPNRKGYFYSPLTTACIDGHIEVAELLLDSGARILEESIVGTDNTVVRVCQALFAAVRRGTPEMVDLLLARGADLNQTDINGETLLHKACEDGNLANAEHLIQLGLDVDARKPHSNETALHYAVQRDRLEVVELLLRLGSDPNIIETYCDRSPLDLAGSESSPIYRAIRDAGGLPADEIRKSGDPSA